MHSVVALFVLAIGLGATFYYWNNLRQSVRSDMHIAYERQRQAIDRGLAARMQTYENFLRGSAGLFAIHSGLTQTEWDTYHKPYNIRAKFPDVQGIGVNRYLKKDEVAAYIQHRIDAGDANFSIRPGGERDIYVPMTYDAQYTGNNGKAKGYDGYTDPVRREAMERSVRTGSLTISGTTRLVSESRPDRTSFVAYLPVYEKERPISTEAERRAALLGFVDVAIDTQSFIDSVLQANQNPNIGLRIHEKGSVKSPIYESANFADIAKEDDSHVGTYTTTLYGHEWQMELSASADLLPLRERQLPTQALWRGLITCIFFSGLVWYLITDRERTYARQKRQEVQTAKDDLLSLASHQLRTPATVVKQYVGMLLQGYAGNMTTQQIDMLNNAYDSNERQLEIINQLLYVARLDAGRITLHTEKVNINEIIQAVTRDQNETLTGRGQELSVVLPKRSITLVADPHYVRMVFENLLSNAIKYTPEKGKISITARREGHYLIVSVLDSGVGIDEDVHSSIFEKFTRVENELSTDVNGSGVGLYLTKQIVELHGGTIEVRSEATRGAEFIVRLPLGGPARGFSGDIRSTAKEE